VYVAAPLIPDLTPDSPPPVEAAAEPPPEIQAEGSFEEEPQDPEVDLRKADLAIRQAKRYLSHDQYWDAIHCLEGAVDLAKGSRTNHAVRVLLARASAKNPKWLKRAETILLGVIAEDPAFVQAHLALGALYKDAGMNSRAEAELRRVLEIYPSHAEAAAELKNLRSLRR
jgi:Tfp pilus assembly protein PilF